MVRVLLSVAVVSPRSSTVLAIPLSTNRTITDLPSRLSKRASAFTYANKTEAAINALQRWYATSTGLWNNECWNSANVLTMIAVFDEHLHVWVSDVAQTVYTSTYNNAQSSGFSGYLNGCYDNELWWDKCHSYVASISNELYITAAAKLANREPITPAPYYYLMEATNANTWFVNTGMINSNNLINDGLDMSSCGNNGGTTWSYNQRVILSGLVELTWSTGDNYYNDLANSIATVTINQMVDSNGVLSDACGSCGGDGGQFKGVFARNVQFMVNRANVLPSNTLWSRDQSGNYLGPVWDGPYQSDDLQIQSSALDLLVAAASVS